MTHQSKIPLENNARITVAGGGPAGSLFAVFLLTAARKAGIEIHVSIVEGGRAEPGQRLATLIKDRVVPGSCREDLRECNFCAGIISPRLVKALTGEGIFLPRDLVCETFRHIWIHGLWKNFPLGVVPGQAIHSVFRGRLPLGRPEGILGLDAFLLDTAAGLGAKIIHGKAQTIHYNHRRRPCVTLALSSGRARVLESDFVGICTGINSISDNPGGSFLNSYQRINPLFRRPETRPALIFELKPGPGYLEKYLDQELHIIVSGGKSLKLDHAALVPKGPYLTISLVGPTIDLAVFPKDSDRIIKAFLGLPGIEGMLPGLNFFPISCTCHPRMATAPAQAPFSHRIALAGDILGARLYRDGLFSSFVSAKALALTIVLKGVDENSLDRGYGWVSRWLARDNRYGKWVVGLFQAGLKFPFTSRVIYQAFATEMKFKTQDKWPLGKILWKIASGGSDYRAVLASIMVPSVWISIFTGFVKTLRNIATEWFFGISWGAFGRYPTVVLREKRDYIKDGISRSLDIDLAPAYGMERMYAIKIRASANGIFRELGRFGESDSRFLNLRFVRVSRVAGRQNQKGAVIRYRLEFLPISMDVLLTKVIPGRGLLYIPEPVFIERGKLVFDISPTSDGNQRLVIYTAFDYKKGKTRAEKLLWKIFSLLFPDYAHDVVWNHALCSIKAEAERKQNQKDLGKFKASSL